MGNLDFFVEYVQPVDLHVGVEDFFNSGSNLSREGDIHSISIAVPHNLLTPFVNLKVLRFFVAGSHVMERVSGLHAISSQNSGGLV